MDTKQVQGGTVLARPEGLGQETPAHKLKVRAVGTGRKFLGIFLYLYVVFGLFNLHEYIVLAQHGIDFTHYGFAAVNAFVMAKVLMIGEELHLGEYFEDRPLIYPILLSSLLFGILLIAFHIIERVIVGLWHGQTMVERALSRCRRPAQKREASWHHAAMPTASRHVAKAAARSSRFELAEMRWRQVLNVL